MTPKDLPEEKRESTSLKIRPTIWKEAKIAAIRQDMELSELVERAIQEFLNLGSVEAKKKGKDV